MEKSEFLAKRNALFTELFKKEISLRLNGKRYDKQSIAEYIKAKVLTAAPAFEGELYRSGDDNKAKTKVMFVGRALNGWEKDLGEASTVEEIVDTLIGENDSMENFKEEGYKGEGNKIYYHSRSKFFRLIKHVLEELGESEKDTDQSFYHDKNNWNQKFVWANLYCISPWEGGNPTNGLIRPGINEYVDLMKLYIDYYEPDAVVFITDVDGWLKIWDNERSFIDIIDGYDRIDGDVIVAKGKVGISKVIVTKRPDRIGVSYEAVKSMANVIGEEIKPSMVKICFSGDFDRSQMVKITSRTDLECTFGGIASKGGEYDYVFVAEGKAHCVNFIYDEASVTVNIINATVEKCVEALLNFTFEGRMSGIDMCDVWQCLTSGDEISFADSVPLSQIDEYSEWLTECAGVLLKIHEGNICNDTDIDGIVRQVSECLKESAAFVWNSHIEEDRDEPCVDMFFVK